MSERLTGKCEYGRHGDHPQGISKMTLGRILQLLAVLGLLTPACKDERITDIQENLRRLTELCANEEPSGYCNDNQPKSKIKFAIEDGKIVFDTGKGNFIYSDSERIVAEIKSDEEKEKEKELKDKKTRVKGARKKLREPEVKTESEVTHEPAPAPEKKGPGSNIDWGLDRKDENKPEDSESKARRESVKNVDWSN